MRRLLMAMAVILAVSVVTAIQSSAQTGVVYGCYNSQTGLLRILVSPSAKCTKGETVISWNQTGPKGETGATGEQGPPGVANGITRAVHGSVDWDGTVEFGSPGFYVSKPVTCSLPNYCQTRIIFDPPFESPPTCTATIRGHAPGPEPTASIIEVSYLPPNTSAAEITFTFRSYDNTATYAGFNFICVY